MLDAVSLFPASYKKSYLVMVYAKIQNIFNSSEFSNGQESLIRLKKEREEALRYLRDESIPVDLRYKKKLSISQKLSLFSQSLRKAFHHLSPWTQDKGKKLLSLEVNFESKLCELKNDILQMLQEATNLKELPPIRGSELEEADEEIFGWLLQINSNSGKKISTLLKTLLIDGPELYERGIVSSKDIKALGIPLNFFQHSNKAIEVLSSDKMSPKEREELLRNCRVYCQDYQNSIRVPYLQIP
ncbi:MAG: hypothetical protein ACI8RA_001502 [Chlamydiales bacterium]|jgi:hypothetical protein